MSLRANILVGAPLSSVAACAADEAPAVGEAAQQSCAGTHPVSDLEATDATR